MLKVLASIVAIVCVIFCIDLGLAILVISADVKTGINAPCDLIIPSLIKSIILIVSGLLVMYGLLKLIGNNHKISIIIVVLALPAVIYFANSQYMASKYNPSGLYFFTSQC